LQRGSVSGSIAAMETAPATAQVGRNSVLASTALIALAFLVVAVIFLRGTTWYQIFKVLHIFFAVVWIGGGLLMTLLGIRAELSNDSSERTWLARQGAFVSSGVFLPSSFVVLAMAFAMMHEVDWGWNSFWILFGLAGFAWTFTTGLGIIVPLTRRLNRFVDTLGPDSPEAQAAISHILLAARIDIAVLLLVVIDMVVKPFS
jgi:uncharacterized membrane protein